MTNLPLGREAYKRASASAPEIKLVNRFFEERPTNLETAASLILRPGTKLLKSIGAGPIRRTWSQKGTFDDALFVVSGDKLFRLNTDNSLEAIDGTVAGDGAPEIDGRRNAVFVADGTNLQYYSGPGASAAGTLSLTGNAANNETVTIGTTVYTFKTALTSADSVNEVLIGATASDSLDNLIASINKAAGGGTLYGTGTDPNDSVTAAAGVGDTMDVTAKIAGTASNTVATTETMANGSWGGATLSGGTTGKATGVLSLTGNAANNETVTIGTTVYTFKTALTTPAVAYEVLIGATASDSLDNLIAAIGATTGAGTLYGSGTAAQSDVVATAGAGDTMDVSARAAGSAYNAIATTETMANGSWGGATLSGGSNAALKTIAVPDSLPVVSVGVLKDYVLVVISTSDKWFYMEPASLVIDPLNFYTAESKPDELINVVIVGDQAWLCGEETIEPWYVDGASSDDPFSQINQRAFTRGVLEGTVINTKESMLLVGDDLVVYEVTGAPQRISTHGIEERIREAVKVLKGLGG